MCIFGPSYVPRAAITPRLPPLAVMKINTNFVASDPFLVTEPNLACNKNTISSGCRNPEWTALHTKQLILIANHFLLGKYVDKKSISSIFNSSPVDQEELSCNMCLLQMSILDYTLKELMIVRMSSNRNLFISNDNAAQSLTIDYPNMEKYGNHNYIVAKK